MPGCSVNDIGGVKYPFRCEADIAYEAIGETRPCTCPPRYFQDGKWWCGYHAPSVKARKSAKHQARRKRELEERRASRADEISPRSEEILAKLKKVCYIAPKFELAVLRVIEEEMNLTIEQLF